MGPFTSYRPKSRHGTYSMTAEAARMLEDAHKRTGRSRSDIVERLIREGAATVEFQDSPAPSQK